jgi:uncharacterized protein YijF (DUF1287 family)/sugar lactone lactonase YvrE/ketosteroid isomerase-like protein
MRSGGGKAGVTGAALAALLLAPGSWGQPPGSIPPVYTQRLQVPVRGDSLGQPRAVVADLNSGEVLVCDTLANRIVIFDAQGRFRYEIPGGSAFQSPVDLAVDPEGYLFVLSQVSSDLTLLDFDGRLIRKAPLTGLPEDARGTRFGSLAISPAGDRLYLMDVTNNRLWITDRQGVVQGSVDTTVGRTQKEIDELRYGHVDVYGDTVLLPIPNDGQVHMFDLEGRLQGTIGAPGSAECQLRFPAAAALDERGRVIILDQQRAMFMTWDLERGVCLSEHYGFGNVPGAFYQPSDMALDASGRLYVSQGFEGRVQVYEGANPAPMLFAARQPAPEIAEETLIADAATGDGARTGEPVATREPLASDPPAAEPTAPPEPAAEAPVEPPVAPTITALQEPAAAPSAAAPEPEPSPAEPAPERPPIGTEPVPVRPPVVTEPVPVRPPVVTEPVPVRPPVVTEPVPVRPPIVTAPAPEPAPPTEEAAPPPAPAAPTPPDQVAASAPAVDSSAFASRVVAGARLSVERAPRYDPAYVELAYPGGDAPLDQGGAVDVVIRAFRHAGIDLQQSLHEDVVANLDAYPINEPDPSIDHRRLRNLVPLFERRAASLPTGPDGGWAPGDVVFWDRNSDGIAGHIGIVADQTGPSGHLLVVHHHRPNDDFLGTPSADDVLLKWPVVGHYRWPSGGAVVAAPATSPAATVGPTPTASADEAESLAAVERTVRAWARAWAGKRIEEYLAFYSPDFEPARGLPRPGWERQRRVRLDRPRSIEVTLERIEPRLTAGDQAQAAFVQTYRSDLYADKVDKVLTLRREGGEWKILSERVVRTYGE